MNRTILAFLLLPFLTACSQPDTEKKMGSDSSVAIENKVGKNGELISPECPAGKIVFGCAITTNLGLMLENPRDLVRGASGGHVPPHPDRSADVIKNYRNGLSEPSASTTSTTTADE